MRERQNGTYRGIPHISDLIVGRIAQAMRRCGLELYESGEGKYLAVAPTLDVFFKFELAFSSNDFNATVLAARPDRPGKEMAKIRQECFAWTESGKLGAFDAFLDTLAPSGRNVAADGSIAVRMPAARSEEK